MTDRTINWVFRATDKTTQAFRSVDSKLAGITKSLRTFAGFAGFAAIAGGVSTLTRSLIELGSELQDASEKFGVSAESLQVLKFAAEQTGSSFESLQSALAFNTRLTGDATRGVKKAAETFRLLGIDVKKFADLPVDRRLAVIAEQLSGVEDASLRADLGMRALGRGSTDLLPLLSQGAGGLAKFDEQLRKTDAVLSDESVKALDDAGDAWEAFTTRLKVNAAPALIGTISLLTRMGEAASKAMENAGNTNLVFGQSVAGAVTPVRTAAKQWQAGKPLTDEESAAVLGIPGLKSTAAVKASLEKSFAELAALTAKSREAYATKAEQAQREIQDRIAAITEQNLTPQEAYAAGLAEVDKLQQSHGLSAETAARQIQTLAVAYSEAAQKQYEATAAGSAHVAALDQASRYIEASLTPLEKYGAELERIEALQAQGYLTAEQAGRVVVQSAQDYAKAQTDIAQGNNQLSESTEKLLRDIKSAADGFARDLTDVFFDATGSIGDMFEDLAETIAKALFTQTVTQPFIDGIMAGVGGFFGGARAAGGPVGAGKGYLVGERGPELFVPSMSGRIIPNGAGGDAQPVQVNMTITSVDPQTAAQTIASQERLITGMVRRAMTRAGARPRMA
jgi:hypothetical protein